MVGKFIVSFQALISKLYLFFEFTNQAKPMNFQFLIDLTHFT